MARIFDCGIDEIVFGTEAVKQDAGLEALKSCTMQDVLQALQMLKSIKG